MQDLLEHVSACREQWQSAEPAIERFLAEAVRRDLDELRRLCDSLVDERSYRPSDRLAAA
jgi:hypothetical protein